MDAFSEVLSGVRLKGAMFFNAEFSAPWRPAKAGTYTLMAKATNGIGDSQPFEGLWNPAGYLWNKVQPLAVTVK